MTPIEEKNTHCFTFIGENIIFSTFNLKPKWVEFITRIYFPSLHLSPLSAGTPRSQGLYWLLLDKQGSHASHVGMSFQCSSQLGHGASKSNLVLETLKQRTRKTVLRRDNWLIFLKIQLTYPLLPCQMPPVVWRNFFLFPPLRHCPLD